MRLVMIVILLSFIMFNCHEGNAQHGDAQHGNAQQLQEGDLAKNYSKAYLKKSRESYDSSIWRDHNGSDYEPFYAYSEACHKIVGDYWVKNILKKGFFGTAEFWGYFYPWNMSIQHDSIFLKRGDKILNTGTCHCADGILNVEWGSSNRKNVPNGPYDYLTYFRSVDTLSLRYFDFPQKLEDELEQDSIQTPNVKNNPTKMIMVRKDASVKEKEWLYGGKKRSLTETTVTPEALKGAVVALRNFEKAHGKVDYENVFYHDDDDRTKHPLIPLADHLQVNLKKRKLLPICQTQTTVERKNEWKRLGKKQVNRNHWFKMPAYEEGAVCQTKKGLIQDVRGYWIIEEISDEDHEKKTRLTIRPTPFFMSKILLDKEFFNIMYGRKQEIDPVKREVVAENLFEGCDQSISVDNYQILEHELFRIKGPAHWEVKRKFFTGVAGAIHTEDTLKGEFVLSVVPYKSYFFKKNQLIEYHHFDQGQYNDHEAIFFIRNDLDRNETDQTAEWRAELRILNKKKDRIYYLIAHKVAPWNEEPSWCDFKQVIESLEILE